MANIRIAPSGVMHSDMPGIQHYSWGTVRGNENSLTTDYFYWSPFIDVFFNRQCVRAAIDTGSYKNSIHPFLLKDLGTTYSGEKLTSASQECLKMSMIMHVVNKSEEEDRQEGLMVTDDFHIVLDSPGMLVLGFPFFYKLKAKLDLAKKKIIFKCYEPYLYMKIKISGDPEEEPNPEFINYITGGMFLG